MGCDLHIKKVGVTGTSTGWTPQQHVAFAQQLSVIGEFDEFHHGGCEGVDVQAAYEVACWRTCLFRSLPFIVRHPGYPAGKPTETEHQAEGKYRQNDGTEVEIDDDVEFPKSHFARNRDIVNVVDLLFVIPKETERQPHGGTWYTHDYALKRGKPVKIIWPDGRAEDKS